MAGFEGADEGYGRGRLRLGGCRSAVADVPTDGDTVGDCVSRAIGAFASGSIHVRAEIQPEAASLPAGPLATVILGAIRRAIRSCEVASQCAPGVLDGHEVIVCARVDGDHLHLHVLDSGAEEAQRRSFEQGPTIEMCRALVEGSGGTLRYRNVPFGPGMFVTATVPVTRLTAC